jgi:hypothetical protein
MSQHNAAVASGSHSGIRSPCRRGKRVSPSQAWIVLCGRPAAQEVARPDPDAGGSRPAAHRPLRIPGGACSGCAEDPLEKAWPGNQPRADFAPTALLSGRCGGGPIIRCSAVRARAADLRKSADAAAGCTGGLQLNLGGQRGELHLKLQPALRHPIGRCRRHRYSPSRHLPARVRHNRVRGARCPKRPTLRQRKSRLVPPRKDRPVALRRRRRPLQG